VVENLWVVGELHADLPGSRILTTTIDCLVFATMAKAGSTMKAVRFLPFLKSLP